MRILLAILLFAFSAEAQVVTHMFKKPVTAEVGGGSDSIYAFPTFVSFSGSNGTGAVNPGLPSGIATGDVLVLAISGEGEDTNADNPPTGGDWTAIDGSTGSVASATDGSADRSRLSVYYHVYNSGSPPSTAVPDAGNHTGVVIMAFRGVNIDASPIDAQQSSSSATNNTGISITGVTTTTDTCLVVYITASGDNNATAYPGTAEQYSGWTNASVANIAEIVDVNGNAGSDWSIGVATGQKTGDAGATGTMTATISLNEEEANWCIALKPGKVAIGGGGGGGVTYDHDTQQYTASAGASETMSHTTTTEDNRIIVVHVAIYPPASAPTEVTYAGQALTLLGDLDNSANINGTLWYRIAPATGSNDVVVGTNLSSAEVAISAITFYNVDQGTGVRNYDETTDDASTYDIGASDLTSGDLRLAVLACYLQVSAFSDTDRWQDDRSGDAVNSMGQTAELSGTSKTMTFTSSEGEPTVVQAVSIIPYTP